MKLLRNGLLGGAATLLIAGGAYAASRDMHTLNVSLPDGSVAHVEYVGKVAPRVVVTPVKAGFAPDPAFGSLDAVFADMERQRDAMLNEAVAMQKAALAQGNAGASADMTIANKGLGPNGTYSYTVVSTTTGVDGCTRTIEWRSDGVSGGKEKQPQMMQTASAQCNAARPDAAAHAASLEKPVAPAAAPGKTI